MYPFVTVQNMETGILLTLLIIGCAHHSLQMIPATGDGQVQRTSEVPCSMLSSLHLTGRQVIANRMFNGEEMCLISSAQIPRSMDELIDGDEEGIAAFASQLRPCDGVLLNKDMCLTQSQNDMIKQYSMLDNFHSGRWKRKALSQVVARWSDNTIPYTIASHAFNTGETRLILEAMSDWERGTCLTFRPANSTDVDKLSIVSGSGCHSRIGRVGGEQELSIGTGLCRTKKVIMHELGHAIGLIHEHQRDDRDNMVTIETNNIDSRYKDQFNKISASIVDVNSVKYDYMSLMHYGKSFFSSDGMSTTIRTLDPKYQDVIGRVDNLSFTDYKAANLMYKCAERCPPHIFCINDGYVGPNCKCICPPNAKFCTARAHTTNTTNTITTTPQTAFTTEPGEVLEEVGRAPASRPILIQRGRTIQRTLSRPPPSNTRFVQGQGQTNQESRRTGNTIRVVGPSFSSSNMPSLLQAILREFPTFTQRLSVSNSNNQDFNRGRAPPRRPTTGKRVMVVRRTQTPGTKVQNHPTSQPSTQQSTPRANTNYPKTRPFALQATRRVRTNYRKTRPVVQQNPSGKKPRFMFHIPGSVIKSALLEAVEQAARAVNPLTEVLRRVIPGRGNSGSARSLEAYDSPVLRLGGGPMSSGGSNPHVSRHINGQQYSANSRF